VGAVRIGFLLGIAGCAASESPSSTVFVSDYRANAIVRYDGATGELLDVFAQGAEQRVDRPASVRRGPDGQIYAAGFGRGDVVRYDLATGAMMDVFYWDTRLLEEPVELEFRGDHLFVLGNDTKNLIEIDPSGAVVRSFGDPTMRGAQDFVIDGDLAYVATESNPTLGTAIQVWDLITGTLVRDFARYDEVAFAAGLALHDGMLYVSDFERGRVTRFDPATGESLGVLVDETALSLPVDVEIGPDGALCVLDATGLHRFDRGTGKPLGRLISVADGILARPLGFTFVAE
jgi:streptogramin lyase